jgi:integrase
MENTSHNFYSLTTRKESPYIYVQFWDAELQRYLPGRSTGKANRRDAERVAQSWLTSYGGLPPKREKNNIITDKQVKTFLTRFLQEKGAIEAEQVLSVDGLLSKTSLVLSGVDMNKANPVFIEYLLTFWDWDTSPCIRDKRESGHSIGKQYCRANKAYIERYAKPFFKEIHIRSVTTICIQEFKDQLSRYAPDNPNGLKPRTINTILGCITTPLGEATKLGIIHENPALKMRKLVITTKHREILTLEEMKKVLAADWVDERSKLASQVAASHGLRAGEVAALQIQDLDFECERLFIRHNWERQEQELKATKNKKSRVVYTDTVLLQRLQRLYSMNPHKNSFIFWDVNNKDCPMNPDLFLDHLRKALETIGISREEQQRRDLDFHAWRHLNKAPTYVRDQRLS